MRNFIWLSFVLVFVIGCDNQPELTSPVQQQKNFAGKQQTYPSVPANLPNSWSIHFDAGNVDINTVALYSFSNEECVMWRSNRLFIPMDHPGLFDFKFKEVPSTVEITMFKPNKYNRDMDAWVISFGLPQAQIGASGTRVGSSLQIAPFKFGAIQYGHFVITY